MTEWFQTATVFLELGKNIGNKGIYFLPFSIKWNSRHDDFVFTVILTDENYGWPRPFVRNTILMYRHVQTCTSLEHNIATRKDWKPPRCHVVYSLRKQAQIQVLGNRTISRVFIFTAVTVWTRWWESDLVIFNCTQIGHELMKMPNRHLCQSKNVETHKMTSQRLSVLY